VYLSVCSHRHAISHTHTHTHTHGRQAVRQAAARLRTHSLTNAVDWLAHAIPASLTQSSLSLFHSLSLSLTHTHTQTHTFYIQTIIHSGASHVCSHPSIRFTKPRTTSICTTSHGRPIDLDALAHSLTHVFVRSFVRSLVGCLHPSQKHPKPTHSLAPSVPASPIQHQHTQTDVRTVSQSVS